MVIVRVGPTRSRWTWSVVSPRCGAAPAGLAWDFDGSSTRSVSGSCEAGAGRWRRSASTRGPSITGCSTRPEARRSGARLPSSRTRRRDGGYRAGPASGSTDDGHPVPPVQHALPAVGRPRDRRVPRCRHAADDARPGEPGCLRSETPRSPTPARPSCSVDAGGRWSDDLVAALGCAAMSCPAARAGASAGDPRDGPWRTVCPVVASASSRHRERGGRTAAAGPAPTSTSRAVRGRSSDRAADPVTTGTRRNVTNELGVDGTVRLLKNVTGLWLLEECRAWSPQADRDPTSSSPPLRAGGTQRRRSRRPRFLPPGDMPGRIAACRESGQPVPASPGRVRARSSTRWLLTWRATVHDDRGVSRAIGRGDPSRRRRVATAAASSAV